MNKVILNFLFIVLLSNTIHSQGWVQKLNGISMWALSEDPFGNIYAGTSGTVKAIYKSTNGGNTWDTVLQNGASNFLYIACDSSNSVYAANVSNGLMKSTNGGSTWTNIPVSVFNNNSVESVLCGKSGYVYVGTINGGIYRSSNNGVSFPDTALSTAIIVTLVAHKGNSNIIFAGASSVTGITGFFSSTDAGTTYGGPYNTNTCWGVVEKNSVGMFMITTTTGYPFSKSTNLGLNWVTVSNQPGAMRGMTLDLAGNIYICGNGGVFKSTDNGITFNNFNMIYLGDQIITYQNKILAAISGTTSGGVWIFTDSLLGVKQISNKVPTSFSLYQNYPNPFNPTTKIKFSIPALNPPFTKGGQGGLTTLKIYDILGCEVATLVNEKLQAGNYEVEFNGSNYASGVYFYKIIITDPEINSGFVFNETRRMVLIK